ncbi:MAG TPA: metal-dependent hydrolase [Nitrospirota bacterium]|jgi:inner membrane protein
MDSITHIVTGAVIAGPVKDKLGWAGAAAVLAGSLAPDADLWLYFLGSDTYLKYHRVAANSLVGMMLVPLLVAWVVRKVSGFPDIKPIYLLVLSAYLVHVFMDLTNSYGSKLLWPFSQKWQSLDIVFIVDPWISGLLLISLALMLLKVKPMPVAVVCFSLLICYWGLRYTAHERALGHFRAENIDAVRVGAFPAPIDPFKWRMVAEYPDRYILGWYEMRSQAWSGTETIPKPPEIEAVEEAMTARAAKIFLDFARFPVTSYAKKDGGWTVSFRDLRFSFRPGDDRFKASVDIDATGRITGSGFHF